MNKLIVFFVALVLVILSASLVIAQPETPRDQLVQEFFLSATGPSHVATSSLINGQDYFLKVTGTYQVAADWGRCIDAAYFCSDSGTATSDTAMSAVKWLWNDVRHPRPAPGEYSPQHVYYFPFTGSGQSESFDFFDDMYADNQRGLTFQVWLKDSPPPPATTFWHEDFGTTYDSTRYLIERLNDLLPGCCADMQLIDGAMRITSSVTGGQARLSTLATLDVTSFTASFRFKIEGAGDGMVFWWYPTLDFPSLGGHGGYQLSWAWSDVIGYGLKLNEYYGNVIALTSHGVGNVVTSNSYGGLNDGNWHQIVLSYLRGTTSVSIDGTPILSAFLPVEFQTGHFVFSASTGGARANHWIDDINITCDNALSVELTSFSAFSSTDGIHLSFATASETSNNYFEILRSTSKEGEFSQIVELQSQGNTSTGHRYEYTDTRVNTGQTYWYYLVDVDVSGTRTEHHDLLTSATAIGSNATITDYSLTAYPNPFNPQTSIAFTLPEAQRVHLLVFDVTGRMVKELANGTFSAGQHHIAFNAGDLPSGVYISRIESGDFAKSEKLLLLK